MSEVSKYGVVGNPIGHSKSPDIHSTFAQQTKQLMEYLPILVGLDEFDASIKEFATAGGQGLNVTVPFKQQAWDIADKLSDRAQLAGAVNTLTFVDGIIKGDNTDGTGLVRDLKSNQGFDFKGKSILVLGAGGAVRGILGPLIDELPADITIANRTLANADALKNIFSEVFDIQVIPFQSLTKQYDLIINGTSASLQNELLPIPDSIVGSTTCLYDMMYSKDQTVFNLWGEKLGADKTIDGLGMLVEQAAEAFSLWRGVDPDTSLIIDKIRQSF